MDIQALINEYTVWLRQEIRFEKAGDHYEITTPFLDDANDHIQFYVRSDGEMIHFTDDGYTINQLIMSGVKMDKARRKSLSLLLQRYGVGIEGDELTTKTDVRGFPKRKHLYIQAIMRVADMAGQSDSRIRTSFPSV